MHAFKSIFSVPASECRYLDLIIFYSTLRSHRLDLYTDVTACQSNICRPFFRFLAVTSTTKDELMSFCSLFVVSKLWLRLAERTRICIYSSPRARTEGKKDKVMLTLTIVFAARKGGEISLKRSPPSLDVILWCLTRTGHWKWMSFAYFWYFKYLRACREKNFYFFAKCKQSLCLKT